MSYGLPYTIVKPCGLLDTPAGNATLTVRHDDEAKPNPPAISRGDVGIPPRSQTQTPSGQVKRGLQPTGWAGRLGRRAAGGSGGSGGWAVGRPGFFLIESTFIRLAGGIPLR